MGSRCYSVLRQLKSSSLCLLANPRGSKLCCIEGSAIRWVSEFGYFRKQLSPPAFHIYRQSRLLNYASPAPKTMRLDTEDFRSLFTPELKTLQDLFEKYGFDLRIAGGAVRDLLRGIKPADVDFATTATPKQMVELFTKEDIRLLNKKGAETHGTVTCRINGKENFEITTLRIDVVCDGRRAEVEWTTDWYKDSERRDLTINSMFLGLDGTVYDYFNGAEDMELRRCAFVKDPSQRIKEDYLRILRYFRFFGRIVEDPNSHEPETIAAIRDNAAGLKNVSGERIWAELKKILTGNHAAPILRTMVVDCKLSPFIGFPENPNLENLERVWKLMRENCLDYKPMTLLASMLNSVDEVEVLNARLKVSKVERLTAEFIVTHRDSINFDSHPNPAKFFQDLYLDFEADKLPENRERICELLKYLCQKDLISHMEKWEAPKFPVTGFDMIDKGVKKGPAMNNVRKHLFELWKKSDYKASTEELLEHCFDEEIPAPPQPKKKRRSP